MRTALVVFVLTVVALAIATEAAEHSPAPAAATPAASKSETLQEVTVQAQRAKLAPRVRKFVNQIAVPENGGASGLARWGVPPVCPLVSGLLRQDGEFILERLSEIARAAAVPLAGEHCNPNLYVLVTTQPENLLRGMEKRNRAFTFGYDPSDYLIPTHADVVDEFIETPRAVRVWYNSTGLDPWGNPLHFVSGAILCLTGTVVPGCDPGRYYLWGGAPAGGSHLLFNTVWTFSRVFVIVDRRRLQGVTRGQLSDYVAMVGFAKLKPDPRLGDAPTILKLFDGAPRAAPAGMTEWDETFLKSLYKTEQTSRQQRGEIARAMVRAITH